MGFTHYVVSWFCLIAIVLLPTPGLAEKPSAPVDIEYTLPAAIQSGDEITTVIQLTAESDLVQILVSVTSAGGLDILSDQREARFLDVKAGETREFEIRVRLTDPKEGFLNVFGTTTSRFQTRKKVIMIPYRVTSGQGSP